MLVLRRWRLALLAVQEGRVAPGMNLRLLFIQWDYWVFAPSHILYLCGFRAFQGGGFKLGSDTVESVQVLVDSVIQELTKLELFVSLRTQVGVPGGAQAKPEERHFVLKM